MRLVIDPGHGGDDPGCVHNGLEEKDLALQIARLFDAAASSCGISVELTREGDTHPSLSERGAHSAKAGAELVISVHANAAATETANYLSAFVLPDDPIATAVAAEIAGTAPSALHGHTQPIIAKGGGQWDRARNVLRPHEGRHPVLVEVGFLTNPANADYLKTLHGKCGVVAALLAGAALGWQLLTEKTHA